MTKRILRPAEAWAKAGVSRSTIYRLEAKGRFPKRVKIGDHASGYIESEVDAWIADCIAARDAQADGGRKK